MEQKTYAYQKPGRGIFPRPGNLYLRKRLRGSVGVSGAPVPGATVSGTLVSGRMSGIVAGAAVPGCVEGADVEGAEVEVCGLEVEVEVALLAPESFRPQEASRSRAARSAAPLTA